jgi:signal transduction histidine kinase
MNLVEAARKMTTPEQTAVWPQRLLLALWTAVAVAFLAIFVTDLWLSYPMLAAPCTGEACHYQAIGPAEAAVLAAWGLPVFAYALYILGISVVPVMLFTALAVLMLVRLYPQRSKLFYALTLIVIPVVVITSFDVVADAFPRLNIPIQLVVIVGHLLLMSLFLVFPRSRFEPRWTAVLPIFSTFFGLYPLFYVEQMALPISHPYFLLLLLVLAVIFYRYRRLFDESEKRQTRLAILGIFIFFIGVPIWSYTFEIAAPAPGQARLLTTVGGWTLCMITTIALPSAIFAAILRDRLWDMAIILNRTLVYGVLSLGIVAVYALVVGGLGSLFHAQGNLLLTLLATGLVALLFQPAREWLQKTINRLMFGERDDPYAVLSKLGRQLGETAVPNQTLPAITATITQTLKLPYAAIELAANEQRQPAASSGERGTAVLQEWPLRYQGEIVGWLQAAPRSPGEPFTAKEQQLLADIAAQAGAAAYSLRLTNALQKSREKLVLTREEERRRIRRDLHDELGPTLASQTFAIDAILDLLESNPTEAERLLRDLKAQNQATVSEIRRLVHELRPPALDELGLVGALEAHAAQLNKPHSLQIQIAATPEPLPPLSAAVEVAAYRIALEAMTNAARHAQAHNCAVHLQAEDTHLTLTVGDDGRGLAPNGRTGVGFHSMRERAEELGGRLSIESGEKEGVWVTAVLPLSSQNEADGA